MWSRLSRLRTTTTVLRAAATRYVNPGKVKKYSLIASLGFASFLVLRRNDYDVSSMAVVRVGRAAFVVCEIAADYKWSLFHLDPYSPVYALERSKVHKRSAERLLKLACDNGGTYIKVGQHLGSLSYLLPVEYVSTLSVLHSKAPTASFDDVCRVIEEDFGQKVPEIFSSFDAVPIGSASLAQVHKAVLKNGRAVAVKVQHRRVKRNSHVDIATMDLLTRAIKYVFPEFKFMWLVEETKKNLPLELDFLHEGYNADRARRMLSHFKFLKIPEILWQHSSDRVLVMEFCNGGQVTDVSYMNSHGISPREVCKMLGQMYSEMIFVHGYVHCDPHPGNVLVDRHSQRGTEIVLLDHGLYTVLDEDFRLHYANLWLGLLERDMERVRYHSARLGVGDLYRLFACMVTTRTWDSITNGIDKQPLTEDENMHLVSEVGNYFREISEVLNSVPRPMLMIFKTNDLLRNVEHSLRVDGGAYSLTQMSLCCAAAVRDYSVRRAESWSQYFGSQVSYLSVILRIYIYEILSSISYYFCYHLPLMKRFSVFH